jgi:hypothetical protein
MEVAVPMRLWSPLRSGLLAAACLALLTPARAAEVDKYLPNDTEILVTFNLRQILDSELVKKHALEQLKAALKSGGEVEKVLEDLGLNPLTDVNSLTVAGPGGDDPKGLIIVHGKFDPAKFAARADEATKQDSHLKITKDGNYTVYEVALDNPGPGPQSMYVAVVDATTLVASPKKSYVIDALDKQAGKKQATLDKAVQALIAKENGHQSIWLVALSAGLAKSKISMDEKAKEVLGKIQSLTLGLTVAKDVRLNGNILAKSPAAADDLKKTIDGLVDQAKGLAALFAANSPQLAPLADVLDSLKINTQKNGVIIQAKVSQEVIDKAIKK